jgi:type IV pilus assembly protein PilE
VRNSALHRVPVPPRAQVGAAPVELSQVNITPARHLTPGPRGFTLVELLIALAVAAILLGIAIPSFQQQLRSSRRTDAIDAIATVQQAQERWRGNNPAYADSLDELDVAATSAGGHYTLEVSDADANGYTLTATAVAGGSQDDDGVCTTLTLTVGGAGSTPSPATCWRH